MHPDFTKKLVRLLDLVDAGVLPKGAIPRLWAHSYGGHLCVNTFGSTHPEYKCVTCGWTGKDAGHQCEGVEVYQTNPIREVQWQCVECSHRWTSEDGDLCPKCLAGPLSGTLALFASTNGLPQSTRDKWPILRELDDIRCSGVPQAMVFEAFAKKKGCSYDEALHTVAMEWWARVTTEDGVLPPE